MRNDLRRSALIVLSSTLAIISVACNGDSSNTPSPSAKSVSASSPAPSSAALLNPPKSVPSPSASTTPAAPDTYDNAIAAASGAKNIAESAQSQDDWKLAQSRWEEAIKLIKAVPASSPNKAKAQKQLSEYQLQLASAKRKANPPPEIVGSFPKFIPTTQPLFKAPIKYRASGIPVIDVTFNGKTFEMLFDTGASHTLVTQEIAYALSLQPIGRARASTANGIAEIDVALIKSMQVSNASAQNVPVGIGAPGLDLGLFGQDYYKGYDVSVKSNLIEFRRR